MSKYNFIFLVLLFLSVPGAFEDFNKKKRNKTSLLTAAAVAISPDLVKVRPEKNILLINTLSI